MITRCRNVIMLIPPYAYFFSSHSLYTHCAQSTQLNKREQSGSDLLGYKRVCFCCSLTSRS